MCPAYLSCPFCPSSVLVALFHPAKQITVGLAVAACISAYDVTFRIDSVCFGKQGSRNVNRLEVALPQQKPMHVRLRRAIEVVSDDVSARVNAGVPGGTTSWKINRLEVAAAQDKPMYATSILEITDNAAIADHGGPRLHRAGEINLSEIAMNQQIAMSNSARKCESHDRPGRADTPTCSNLSTGVFDRCKCTRTQPVGKNFAIDETIRAHNLSARIDPPCVGEISTRKIDGSEIAFLQNKSMEFSIGADIPSENFPCRSNSSALSLDRAWEIK